MVFAPKGVDIDFGKGANKVKKIITLVMALALVMSLAVPAFAYGPGDEKELDVTAKYNSSTTTGTVYSVDIDWDSLTFTYNEKSTKTWKPSDHSYTTDTQGGWDKTSANITVTNHSNAAVTVDMAYTTSTTGTGVTATLTGGSKTLAAGAENQYATADSVTGKLTISGKPNSNVTANGITVGSVTITISK